MISIEHPVSQECQDHFPRLGAHCQIEQEQNPNDEDGMLGFDSNLDPLKTNDNPQCKDFWLLHLVARELCCLKVTASLRQPHPHVKILPLRIDRTLCQSGSETKNRFAKFAILLFCQQTFQEPSVMNTVWIMCTSSLGWLDSVKRAAQQMSAGTGGKILEKLILKTGKVQNLHSPMHFSDPLPLT